MNRSLRRLIATVAVIGVNLAILRHALQHWGPGEVIALAPVVLVVASLLAAIPLIRGRAFWAGFALVGWACLGLLLMTDAGEYLPTTAFLDDLHGRIYTFPPMRGGFAPLDFDDAHPSPARHLSQFRRAGDTMLSLVLALFGGLLARILLRARSEGDAEETPPDGSLLGPGRSHRTDPS